jgi:hypothetical protein
VTPTTIDATVLDALRQADGWQKTNQVFIACGNTPYEQVELSIRRLVRARLVEAHPNGFQWRAAPIKDTTP